MAKYEKNSDPLAGIFDKKESDVSKVYEAQEEHEVIEEVEVLDVSVDKTKTDEISALQSNDFLKQIAKMVHEVSKETETHEEHKEPEVQYAQTYGSTQGKKGKKLHKMNTGYTQPNWEFLTKESRKMGLRGGATELVNMIIDDYRKKKK